MASMQTRLVQGAVRMWEKDWKQHQGMCPACSRLKHDRRAEPCGPGAQLRNELAALRATARHEAKLDKAVPPGQGTLF